MSSSTCAPPSRIPRRTPSLRSSTFMPRTRPRASRSRRFALSSPMRRSPSTARLPPPSAPGNASAMKSGPCSTRSSTASRCSGRSATAPSARLSRGPRLPPRGSRDELCLAAVTGAPERLVQPPEQLDQDLEQDQQDDGHFQEPHTPVARDVEHELQRLAHSVQLLLHGGVAVDQIELGTQLVVNPVHRR